MKEDSLMSFLEKHGITRSYLRKFYAINIALFAAQIGYFKMVVFPRNREIKRRWFKELTFEQFSEYSSKPAEERDKILNEVINQEYAKAGWIRIF